MPSSSSAAPRTAADIVAWAEAQVAPRAVALDQDPAALRWGLDALAAAGLLGPLKVDAAAGGLGLGAVDRFRVDEALARASGALAFLQTQHQSAAAMVAQADGPGRSRLPDLLAGRLRAGIAFGHLRRAGPPALRAEPDGDGYRLHGQAPWFTGWGLLHHAVTAATLPGGDTLFVLHPVGPDVDGLRAGAVMRLAAMEVCQTVPLHFEGLRIPDSDLLMRRPASWIADNDRSARARQAASAIGCAQAGLDVVAGLDAGRVGEDLCGPLQGLAAAVEDCRDSLLHALRQPGEEGRELALRAEAIALMGRCAHAAVVASAGAGNLRDHAAQRVYREALAWTVLAQSREIRQATLRRLGP